MHDEKPQSLHFTHINHCLDALRQEIICNADDTPRYSALDQKMGTREGQHRMCKDWGKMEGGQTSILLVTNTTVGWRPSKEVFHLTGSSTALMGASRATFLTVFKGKYAGNGTDQFAKKMA